MVQTSLNAIYGLTDHVGLAFGLAYFDADVRIEDDVEKTEIAYGYNGSFVGMHFLLMIFIEQLRHMYTLTKRIARTHLPVEAALVAA